jgi:hypothetical protein
MVTRNRRPNGPEPYGPFQPPLTARLALSPVRVVNDKPILWGNGRPPWGSKPHKARSRHYSETSINNHAPFGFGAKGPIKSSSTMTAMKPSVIV